MKRFIANTLKRTRSYTIWDFACLKITLLSLGIMLGAYFSTFFMNWIFSVLTIFVFAWIWITYRTFMK